MCVCVCECVGRGGLWGGGCGMCGRSAYMCVSWGWGRGGGLGMCIDLFVHSCNYKQVLMHSSKHMMCVSVCYIVQTYFKHPATWCEQRVMLNLHGPWRNPPSQRDQPYLKTSFLLLG